MTSFSNDRSDVRTLYIFGAGGHGRELAWLAKQIFIDAVSIIHVVDEEKYWQENVNGHPVVLLADIKPSETDRFVVALGDCAARRLATARCVASGLMATVLVHPRAEVSDRVELGEGAVICAGTIISTNIRIGKHVHVNIGCTISHDVVIGEYSTLSPGVHVSGHVSIGKDVFIGTGANIINGSQHEPLVIGDGAIVAAGACVIASVAPGSMVAGVPARMKY